MALEREESKAWKTGWGWAEAPGGCITWYNWLDCVGKVIMNTGNATVNEDAYNSIDF